MTRDQLREEIAGELGQMDVVGADLLALSSDISENEPALREKVAAAGFLSPFYTGVENILGRISRFCDVPMPTGEHWHAALSLRFSETDRSERDLPLLFDTALAAEMARYHGFRHLARSNHGLDLCWSMMAEGIDRVEGTFRRFNEALLGYLDSLALRGS